MTAIIRYITEKRQRCYELCRKYYSSPWKSPVDIYREQVQGYSSPSCILLNAGCGLSRERVPYTSLSAMAVGIDIDLRSLAQNRALDQLVNGNLACLPFKDGAFDIIVCKDVLEHLPHPLVVFQEFSRALKNGGRLIVLTPNIYNYVSMISKITPHRFHRIVNRMRGVHESETFPTYYRANSIRRLDRLSKRFGFKVTNHLMMQKWPSYLIFSVALFWIGIIYERILNRFGCLRFLRSAIIAVFTKEREPLSGGQ